MSSTLFPASRLEMLLLCKGLANSSSSTFGLGSLRICQTTLPARGSQGGTKRQRTQAEPETNNASPVAGGGRPSEPMNELAARTNVAD